MGEKNKIKETERGGKKKVMIAILTKNFS